MGAALERLSLNERDSIARSLLKGCDNRQSARIGAHCPFHSESTPGGAFFYDVERDLGYCHSCQQHGDLIDIYALAHGYLIDDPEAFRAFWRDFGPDKLQKGGGRKASGNGQDDAPPAREPWKPVDIIQPPALWRKKAMDFVQECTEALQASPGPLHDLERLWGITPTTAAAWRIGYNPKEQFKAQKGWGLPEEKNENGRDKAIHLPQGYVFPVFGEDGGLLRAKIRLQHPREQDPRYKAVKGGSPNCYGLWGFPERDKKIWIVVETERDALYIAQELERFGLFGAMAVGTARLEPDAFAHSLLAGAEFVINALDNDQAGATASWRFAYTPERFSWNQTYAHTIRWPVPRRVGKDAGDMHGKLDVWEWISAALPLSVARRCEAAALRLSRAGGGNG